MTMNRLSVLIAALWWGAISGMGFVAVPLMFAKLGPAMAGPVAAKLFSIQCWMGLGLGMALLLALRHQREALMGGLETSELAPDSLAALQRLSSTMGVVMLAMLLALVQEFGVAQKIVTARASGGNLPLWHGVGSLMVLGQWLCAGAVLWRVAPK